jgi:hypothetical protein
MKTQRPNGRIGPVIELTAILALVAALGIFVFNLNPAILRPSNATGAIAPQATSTDTPGVGAVGLTPTVPAPSAIPKPGETGVPTPWPTMILPPMTPVPTARNAIEAGVEEPTPATFPTAGPTPKPSDPYQLEIAGARYPSPAQVTNDASMIVIGTVMQVGQARWTTSSDARPANPHDMTNRHSIYRPVVLEVEQYLKGAQPQPQLLIWALGGRVGKDSVTYTVDDLYTFHKGDRVLVYLVPHSQSLNNQPLLRPRDRYLITPDNQATNVYRDLPLLDLIGEIQTLVRQSK